MKKLLVLLMSLMLIFNLAAMAFAAGGIDSPGEPVYDDSGDYGNEPMGDPNGSGNGTNQNGTNQNATGSSADEVESVKVELEVIGPAKVGDVELDAGDVSVATVSLEDLAKEQPVVAETIKETKALVTAIAAQNADPEQRQKKVEEYFAGKGDSAKNAITEAIKNSNDSGVKSMADITPVMVDPIKIDISSKATEAMGPDGSVQMEIAIPDAFVQYDLNENSFLCAELIDENGNVHIVTFTVVDGKLVGNFPAKGVISNFWVGSNNSSQLGNTNLDGVIVCGMLLCAAALLFSVKRIKVQD